MIRDSRITAREVTLHETPDGRRFDTEAQAASHLSYLDAQARDARVRDALERLFWDSPELQERFQYESSAFAERMLGLVRDHLDDIRILAPSLDAVVAAWDGVEPPAMTGPEVPPARPPARQSRRRAG